MIINLSQNTSSRRKQAVEHETLSEIKQSLMNREIGALTESTLDIILQTSVVSAPRCPRGFNNESVSMSIWLRR